MLIFKIQYQTSDITPPPFSKSIEVNFIQKSEGLWMEYNLEFLGRENISIEEIENEGFTQNDNLTWEGMLPNSWAAELNFILTKTTNSGKSEIDEDEEYYLVEMKSAAFSPKNKDQIQYFLEEINQAVLEKIEVESKLKITFLKNSKQNQSSVEVNCSFFERNLTIISTRFDQKTEKELAWHQSKSILSEIFDADFNPEAADLKKPSREGIFINIGDDNWYQKEKTWLASRPVRFLKDL
jgi:hypothetical protein